MDIDKAKELIGKTDTSTELHCIMKGLQILAKYEVDDNCGFEHDIILADCFEKSVSKMSVDDVLRMARLGWFYHEEAESWAHY
ncbi:MAG: hypothetical protein Q7R84_02245 [bacterium]|nr:hypothetical protein [bacterium]